MGATTRIERSLAEIDLEGLTCIYDLSVSGTVASSVDGRSCPRGQELRPACIEQPLSRGLPASDQFDLFPGQVEFDRIEAERPDHRLNLHPVLVVIDVDVIADPWHVAGRELPLIRDDVPVVSRKEHQVEAQVHIEIVTAARDGALGG